VYFFQPFSVGKGPLALRPLKPLSEKEGVYFPGVISHPGAARFI